MSDLGTQGPPQAGSFDFNRPTIIALCYLGGAITGISGLVGLVLAYVWRNEPHQPWEDSHYTYLIRTFWLWLAGLVLGIVLSVVVIGAFLIAAVCILFVVRCVLVLVNAQKQAAMPNPETMLA